MSDRYNLERFDMSKASVDQAPLAHLRAGRGASADKPDDAQEKEFDDGADVQLIDDELAPQHVKLKAAMQETFMNRLGLGVSALIVTVLLSTSLILWTWWRLSVAQTQLAAAQSALAAAEIALVAYKVKAKAEQEAAVKTATQREKWKQKAAGKGKRLAVAVPVAGAALAVWFEEREYREWRAEHQEFKTEIEARKAYYEEIYDLCGQALDEELKDFKSASPETWKRIRGALDDWYRSASSSLSPTG